ncbi:hypothetical protein NMY3_01596 [Candidatus Nitrosocosmicus oleophilus]|uniref:Uncharacterized protein n=1 Tax=Candidatus Nitrosocosmicus oleophilus TaxID=1353260 RepID=A0A654LZZ7_9ARCH|nr:hypothetical protein [Candidatus Nitrosocosmicus oleophilus]ALI35799.1 hypothetical protein NMY3_01596 [Candidatus Nitrosocosmicus oleophilus]
MQELSRINLIGHQSKDEFENKIGKMIGLENAAIKTLKTIATLNRKDLKTNMKKNADMKARSKFNRIKTKKLSKVFDNIGNSEINQSMVEEIAMETEQKALATLHYYLLDTNINEQDCDAYRSSKFLCLSQEGNSIEHTCCYFY